MEYLALEIEKKWQEKWEKDKVFKTENNVEGKENYYVLEMFAYPSGKLHAGHLKNYTLGDAIARFQKLKGYNVIHPMGWDSFGLPAENAAIDNGANPKEWTAKNIENMKRQLKLIGLSYDWDREISTYSEKYYKFNQKLFIDMYKKGLVYKKKSYVNWCPDCSTVLANEQVEQGKCWRHGKTDVIQKELSQWYFKITKYAQELLDDHEKLKNHWPSQVLTMQKNWIGRSSGAEVNFKVDGEDVIVFTTRLDTIFGVTYIVLAPEHSLVQNRVLVEKPELKEIVDSMINEDKISRESLNKEKTGVFTGLYATHPLTNEKIPVYIGNYVLMNYGTGAVMAVPAHDERDLAFSKKYNLDSIQVLENDRLINSNEFCGFNYLIAREKIVERLEKLNLGKKTVNYRLHDWLISRQRYWGTPIPVIYDEQGNVYLDENLPVKLPEDIEFTKKGNPIKTSKLFNEKVILPNGKIGYRETDTMDTFVDSSWYYLRYLDPNNEKEPFDKDKVKGLTPVTQYIGGIEHAVMHLLYSRFIHKVFRDLGYLDTDEPFKNLITQGMVLNNSYYSQNERRYLFEEEVEKISDEEYVSKKTKEKLVVKVEKMSKSKNNGIDPEKLASEYGADASRLFCLFAAPVENELVWNMNGVVGAYRFINRIYLLSLELKDVLNKEYEPIDYDKRNDYDIEVQRKLHNTIKKVTDSMQDNYHFNTAIASIMELLNDLTTYKQNIIDKNMASSESYKIIKDIVLSMNIMISPITPHIAEEIWEIAGQSGYVFNAKWPEYIEKLTKNDNIVIAIQVNGKLRDTVKTKKGITEEQIITIANESNKVANHIHDKKIIKIIYVQDKLLNIVVE